MWGHGGAGGALRSTWLTLGEYRGRFLRGEDMELRPEDHLRQTEREGMGDVIQEGLHVQRPEAGRESMKPGLKVAHMGSDAG